MSEQLQYGLDLTIVGILIVFLVLAVIAIVVRALRAIDTGWVSREREEAVRAEQQPPTIDATTLVIIAAVTATLVQGRHFIKRVRRLPPLQSHASSWSQQGRAVLHGSHVVNRANNGTR